MKKVISLVMAFVMMMAIMVPAFAVDLHITQTGAQAGQSTVQTDISKITEGVYTITYPSIIDIEWGEEGTATYSVEASMKVGKKLTVSVADTTTQTLTGKLAATDITDTLDYTISGDTTAEYTGGMNETESLTFTVADWNKTVSEYAGYVTFTASVSDM